MSSRTSRALSGTVSSALQYILIMVLQFVLVPVIIKFASDEILGLYSYLLQIIGWAALSDLGFGVAASRYLAQSHIVEDNHKKFSNIFSSSRTFFLGTNILFSLIVFIISFNLEKLIQFDPSVLKEAKLSLNLLATWIAIRTPLLLFGDALIATQNITSNNIILAKTNTFRLFVSLVLVFLGTGILGLIIAYILAELLTLFLQRRKYFKIFPNDKFSWGVQDKAIFKEMFKFGMVYMLMSVSSKIANSSDSIIVGSILGASAVAVLYASQMPGTLIFQFIWKIADNSSPALNDLFSNKFAIKIRDNYLKILKYSLLIVFPLAIGVLTFNREFVAIWSGEETYAGHTFNLLFSLYCITQVIMHINAIMLVVLGEIKRISILTFILCTGKLLFSFLFLERIGLYGIVLSNLMIDIPLIVYTQRVLFKLINLKAGEMLNSFVVIPIKASLFLIIYSLCIQIFEVPDGIGFFIIKVVGFIVIFLLSLLLWGLNQNERLMIKNFVRSSIDLQKR